MDTMKRPALIQAVTIGYKFQVNRAEFLQIGLDHVHHISIVRQKNERKQAAAPFSNAT